MATARPHPGIAFALSLAAVISIVAASVVGVVSASPSHELAHPDQWDPRVADLAKFVEMVKDEKRNLFEPFPWGDGQTLLREALLIADHNSYHLGQLMLVRRMLESDQNTA